MGERLNITIMHNISSNCWPSLAKIHRWSLYFGINNVYGQIHRKIFFFVCVCGEVVRKKDMYNVKLKGYAVSHSLWQTVVGRDTIRLKRGPSVLPHQHTHW